jgi:hypothetical protein
MEIPLRWVFDPRFVLFCLFVSFLSFRMIELLQIEISICLIGIDGILSEFLDEPQFLGFFFQFWKLLCAIDRWMSFL